MVNDIWTSEGGQRWTGEQCLELESSLGKDVLELVILSNSSISLSRLKQQIIVSSLFNRFYLETSSSSLFVCFEINFGCIKCDIDSSFW